ncbi:MAG TPA: kelch repeat-containing protein [Gaiellaceae bacterium]|jgi:N-acetylneuraminic acid mutarotase|nr:kelch repeat-containing protein [Gaiellaceae bacterium]
MLEPRRSFGLVALALLAVATPSAAAPSARWESRAPLPVPRTEVSAAATGGRIVVAGGFLADGSSSPRVDAYDPATDTWTRLPDLPFGVNHAAAAAYRGRVYVLGGYATHQRLRTAWVLRGGGWRTLPKLPFERGAAAAAVAGGRLYVVGGVGPSGLARNALVLDLARVRWSLIPGPRPREHLAAASAGGRVYAIAGRLGGLNSNLDTVESIRPGGRRWRLEPSIPQPRGGTGAAVVDGRIVSVGGEAPDGTIERVYRFDPATRRWSRLPDLPTPRHGLGVAALGGRVYVVAGGPQPGLFVSAANEVLVP